ncbi:helix-turn-helix transcriptional regulator [Flavobacterium sp. P4023]|uniref:Helix-turn-helix transcriptional regulator n=2 Tax=Flavobacterium flabelliforme TaxID=2816119 RepID=A0ABS5CTP6_9FLAO|nr:helix-turn-helix transcriptional regulator [Flavobacterium flabelliforme]
MDNDDFTLEKKALGNRVQELRLKIIDPSSNNPISQEELGLRAGTAKKTIGEIERGVTNSKFETLLMISKALNITINELFHFDMEKYKAKRE